MHRYPMVRRITALLPVAALLMALIPPPVLVAEADAANAEPKPTRCSVVVDDGKKTGDLQAAIDSAGANSRISINGTCVGNFTVWSGSMQGKPLTLKSGSKKPAVLDGTGGVGYVLDIEGGLVTLTDITVLHGSEGGISVSSNASLNLTGRSLITGNTGTGIVNLGGASLTLSGTSAVTGNTGGGIGSGRGSVSLSDSATVSGNSGVGIDCFVGDVSLSDSATVSHNTGAGIDAYCNVTLSGSAAVTDNTGGGIFEFRDLVTLSDSATVSGNSASNGGGISLNEGYLSMSGTSAVSGNSATGQGGGIFADPASGTVTLSDSSVVTGNSATDGGGIVGRTVILSGSSAVTGNTATGIGGGISLAFGYTAHYLSLSGSASVTGNTAGARGGAIDLGNGIIMVDPAWTGSTCNPPNSPNDFDAHNNGANCP